MAAALTHPIMDIGVSYCYKKNMRKWFSTCWMDLSEDKDTADSHLLSPPWHCHRNQEDTVHNEDRWCYVYNPEKQMTSPTGLLISDQLKITTYL